MRRIKLVIEYDGTAFHGWQSQKNASSVQDVLAAKLKVLLNEAVTVAGAGRTDAGVHAYGQVAAFDSKTDKSLEKIVSGLNGLLPRDVRVRSAEVMPPVFDPRRDAMGKTYRYTWIDGDSHSPFWRRYSWWSKQPLDNRAMAIAAKHLVGEHDFSAFRAAACAAKSPVRKMHKVEIRRKGQRVTLEIHGTAFLQNMVRIIAGTLYDVGTGKRSPDSVKELLASKDRKLAGKTAPPEGLVLWQVDYGAIPRPGRRLKGQPGPVEADDAGDD